MRKVILAILGLLTLVWMERWCNVSLLHFPHIWLMNCYRLILQQSVSGDVVVTISFVIICIQHKPTVYADWCI